MSKYDICVGDEFPLNEGQQDDRGGPQGRHHCRHRHGHHHAHHHHVHDDDRSDRVTAMAMLFALKAWRRHMRRFGETV